MIEFASLVVACMIDTKSIIAKDGIVKEIQAAGLYKVELDDASVVWAIQSGRMFRNRIRLLVGDKVKVEFSPHDLTRGRISYRY